MTDLEAATIMQYGSKTAIRHEIFSVDADLESITYGHDGVVWTRPSADETDPEELENYTSDITDDDLRKIADAMIARWTRFRETLSK